MRTYLGFLFIFLSYFLRILSSAKNFIFCLQNREIILPYPDMTQEFLNFSTKNLKFYSSKEILGRFLLNLFLSGFEPKRWILFRHSLR